MGIMNWLSKKFSSFDEHDEKLLKDVIENYQPSMRVSGDRTLTMGADIARKTAKIYGQNGPHISHFSIKRCYIEISKINLQ